VRFPRDLTEANDKDGDPGVAAAPLSIWFALGRRPTRISPANYGDKDGLTPEVCSPKLFLGREATMDYHKNSNGWLTFLEHWGLVIIMAVAIVSSQTLMLLFRFLCNLSAAQWVLAFLASSLLMTMGAVFIGYAKLPAYRSGNWLSFGAHSVPNHLAGFHRWGWRLFTLGMLLSIFLYFAGRHAL
jgi:hypothetical protein